MILLTSTVALTPVYVIGGFVLFLGLVLFLTRDKKK